MIRKSQIKTSGRRKATSADALDCATAFQTIARGCVTKIKAHHSSACAGDAEAVHQIRVAITRLRAAVTFFAPMTVDAGWLHVKKEIAWLNVSLGAARDSDVVAEYARRERYRAWVQHRIGRDLAARQTRDHRRLVRCLRSMRFQGLIEAMSDWIERGPWLARREQRLHRKPAKPLKAYSEARLDRWRRRLIRKGRLLATLNGSRRHRLRIRAKRFRYMLEALTDIIPLRNASEFRHVHRPAKRLQRVLGDHRDLERFARLAPPPKDRSSGQKRPPGYRRKRQKLLNAAIAAYRRLKQAGAC